MTGDKTNSWEVKVVAVVSIIATAAIIMQCSLKGFTLDNVLSGIIQFTQVFLASMVVIIAIRSLISMRKLMSFEQVLAAEMDAWTERSRPLIRRDGTFQKGQRYFMLTNHDHILYPGEPCTDNNIHKQGQFVVLPLPDEYTKDRGIVFFMNKTTFLDRAKAKNSTAEEEMYKVGGSIAGCINKNFNEIVSASLDPSKPQINVALNRDLTTPDDARSVAKLIEYVMTLYMVAS